MTVEQAPAKVNLVLQVGSPRADGLHELCSLFCSLELADELTIEVDAGDRDVVVCAGVEGPNLAEAALVAVRAELGDAQPPPLRVTIEKRIPVAAGRGGGSADAAAVLRAVNRLAGGVLATDALRAVGGRLGADVPSQIEPRHALVTGAGERVEPLALPAMSLVLVPAAVGLSTAEVYREADRVRSTRRRLDPERLRTLARSSLDQLAAGLENDLEPAALALRPELGETLRALRGAGALGAGVTGSGPTAFGVFADRERAQLATRSISGAIVTGLRPSPASLH